MSKEKKSLRQILRIPEAAILEELIASKCDSPSLVGLDDPQKVVRFMRANLRASYVFGRFIVPSYASAVFSSLTTRHPVDNSVGDTLARVIASVSEELCTNNIFWRSNERHSHFWDALESYHAGGGDMVEIIQFMALVDTQGLMSAIEQSTLWTAPSAAFAKNALNCCDDPLALFILMPANEEMAPATYAKALTSLSSEARFAKFRRFLETHVGLDNDEHGPAALDWLDIFIRSSECSEESVRAATKKVITVFSRGTSVVRG